MTQEPKDDLELEYDFPETLPGKYYISTQAPLGSRIAARFAGWGLTQDVPEVRGEEVRAADFES